MAKREKRLKKSIESLKKKIEEHFDKLEKDIERDDEILVRYHIKEIDLSLIADLEYRLGLLGGSKDLVEEYRKRLERIKGELGIVLLFYTSKLPSSIFLRWCGST